MLRSASTLPALALLLAACRPVSATVDVEPQTNTSEEPRVFVESSPSSADSRVAFKHISAEYASLYTCWFEHPYDYMFEGRGEPLVIDGHGFGMMMAGIDGILYYGHFNECAGRLNGVSPKSYSDIGPIEALAGVSATLDAPALPFDAVNPEIIFWARANLLPAPHQSIRNIPVAVAYKRVFQRFFRAMAESLAWMMENHVLDDEAKAYIDAVNQGADGIDWLQQHYASIPIQDAYADGTQMTGQMAAGFWLRRSLDHSIQPCWHALLDVLERYDPAFVKTLPSIYPMAMQELAKLPDAMETPDP